MRHLDFECFSKIGTHLQLTRGSKNFFDYSPIYATNGVRNPPQVDCIPGDYVSHVEGSPTYVIIWLISTKSNKPIDSTLFNNQKQRTNGRWSWRSYPAYQFTTFVTDRWTLKLLNIPAKVPSLISNPYHYSLSQVLIFRLTAFATFIIPTTLSLKSVPTLSESNRPRVSLRASIIHIMTKRVFYVGNRWKI